MLPVYHHALDVLTKRPMDPWVERVNNIPVHTPSIFDPSEKDVRALPIPDLTFANAVDKHEAFSLFVPKHRECASTLIWLIMKEKDHSAMASVATYCRNKVNPYMFQYALAVIRLHHREEREKMWKLPSTVSLFPDQFIDPTVFVVLHEKSYETKWEAVSVADVNPEQTASDRDEEQRMAYFREDVGVSMHHNNWHLVYPGDGPDEVVNKDRRGELFFYMNSQLIARYNVDRFCNKLKKVRPLTNFREPIPEAFFPNLINLTNNRPYPGRSANAILQDVDRNDLQLTVSVNDLESWRDRIHMAIDQGFLLGKCAEQIILDERCGIDLLGNVVEGSKLSLNRKLYGNLLGKGHAMLAYIHDPENRYMEGPGVMGGLGTATRDPVFYRWHGMIDGIFRRHKELLPPYTPAHLSNPGVSVVSVKVQTKKGPPNQLYTFWQRSQVDLGNTCPLGTGNFGVYGAIRHLQHDPFIFRVNVNNESGVVRKGTLRIWIAPKVDERGTQLQFREQRLFFVEMDRSTVTLNPGKNKIFRKSKDSSVAIPDEGIFATGPKIDDELKNICGWPQHMLVPMGDKDGVQYDLFAMITDCVDDIVVQQFDPSAPSIDTQSMYGLGDRKYPDRRAMGYPFDRPTECVTTLNDFVALNSNMTTNTITVTFTDTVINPEIPEAENRINLVGQNE